MTWISVALPDVFTTIESITSPLYFALRASSEYSGRDGSAGWVP